MTNLCNTTEIPNLHKDIFPYDSLPLQTVGGALFGAGDIFISDTTLRDGQQSMNAFTKEQSVAIYKMLHRLGGDAGVIRQSEFFVYGDNDRGALLECMDLGYRFPEITTWIRADARDFDLIKNLGVKETGFLMSCSDYHIYKKLNMTREQAMQKYLDVAGRALDMGIKPRCHLEDLTRADIDGFVVPLVQNLNALCGQAGMDLKIRMCDTLGLGLAFESAALPRSVPKLVRTMREDCGLRSDQLEWHGHNDFHMAVANSVSAWESGCACVSATMFGIGERCGNTPIDGMIVQYAQMTGSADLDLDLINGMAVFFEEELGVQIPVKYPLFGADFNTTQAGIHADGLLKSPDVYTSFDTNRVLNRPIVIKVNQTSGTAGIAGWINSYYKLDGTRKIDKRDEFVFKIKSYIDAQYEAGRTDGFTNEEMHALVQKYQNIETKTAVCPPDVISKL